MPGPFLDRYSALFLDVDGTLLDIALTPGDVLVPPGLGQSLQQVSDLLGGAMALVSGRPVTDIDHLFCPLSLPAAGKHGAEIRLHRGGTVRTCAKTRVGDAIRQAVAGIAEVLPSVLVEEKETSIALHYRRDPGIGAELGARLRTALAADGNGLSLMPGRMVWEIRGADVSKAAAVRCFMTEPQFAIRRPVFVGDDVTDEDGFTEVERRGGLALVVAGGAVNGRPVTFEDPTAVRRWLRDLPDMIRA